MTEVQGDGLKEGLEVVVGEQMRAAGNTGTVNPFTPQFRFGRQQGQQGQGQGQGQGGQGQRQRQ